MTSIVWIVLSNPGLAMSYDSTVFQNPERAAAGDLVVASYYIETTAPDLVKKAGGIAIGQTTGGWVGLPRADREVMERAVGRVLSVVEVPPEESRRVSSDAARRAIVRIGYPIANIGGDSNRFNSIRCAKGTRRAAHEDAAGPVRRNGGCGATASCVCY